jgi:hypothetical protein
MRLEDLIAAIQELVNNDDVDADTEVFFFDESREHFLPVKIKEVDKGGSLILDEDEEQ